MDIRVRAAGRTAKMFAISALIPLAVMFLFQIDAETLFYLFLFAFLCWMIWVVYSINLGQIESEETVREIQQRRNSMSTDIVNKNQSVPE